MDGFAGVIVRSRRAPLALSLDHQQIAAERATVTQQTASSDGYELPAHGSR